MNSVTNVEKSGPSKVSQAPPTLEATPSNGKQPSLMTGYQIGEYVLIELSRADSYSNWLFSAFVDRAIEFIRRYGADTDPIWLRNQLESAYGTNYLHLLAAVDSDNTIVAHTVSYYQNYPGLGNTALILQDEQSVDESRLQTVGMDLIKDWAKRLGLKIILSEAMTRSRARLFQKLGFHEHRIMMRMDI